MREGILAFSGRFTLLYALIYLIVAAVFIQFQQFMEPAQRLGLDFYQPYSLTSAALLTQVLVGLVMAVVIYPFYKQIVYPKSGWFTLFLLLWGVSLLCSLEPKPGTIEGLLYTEISYAEHILVLAAGAIQFLVLTKLFLLWERKALPPVLFAETESFRALDHNHFLRGYLRRYTFWHVLVYMLVGAVFYQISGYGDALEAMDEFALWRDLEQLHMPLVIVGGQIFRGLLTALFLLPLYQVYMQKAQGWVFLFGLLFGLQVLTTVLYIPDTFPSLSQALQGLKIGIPEITAQTFVFSGIFYFWEKRAIRLQKY